VLMTKHQPEATVCKGQLSVKELLAYFVARATTHHVFKPNRTKRNISPMVEYDELPTIYEQAEATVSLVTSCAPPASQDDELKLPQAEREANSSKPSSFLLPSLHKDASSISQYLVSKRPHNKMRTRGIQQLLILLQACFWGLGLSQILSGDDYCALYIGVYSYCASETPGFSTLPLTERASCLCGSTISDFNWGPSSFDNAIASCASYEATNYPPIVPILTSVEYFCVEYGPSAQAGLALAQVIKLSQRTLEKY
jgi:hypothetical protein